MEEINKKLTIGYVKYENRNHLLTTELRLKNNNFAASANLYNVRETDIIIGGQCFDTLLKEIPELSQNELFQEVYDLWSKYHLNDMHAGTKEQEKAINEWKNAGNQYDYKAACDYLKGIGLYEVSMPDGSMYQYGHSWLREEIPEQDIERIKSLILTGEVLSKDPELDVDLD